MWIGGGFRRDEVVVVYRTNAIVYAVQMYGTAEIHREAYIGVAYAFALREHARSEIEFVY